MNTDELRPAGAATRPERRLLRVGCLLACTLKSGASVDLRPSAAGTLLASRSHSAARVTWPSWPHLMNVSLSQFLRRAAMSARRRER